VHHFTLLFGMLNEYSPGHFTTGLALTLRTGRG
jgi:hypothetical protein